MDKSSGGKKSTTGERYQLDAKKLKSSREVNNEFFQEVNPKGHFKEAPKRKYLVSDYVKPSNVKDLSKDEYITFDLKTSEGEVLFFPDDYQIYMEANLWYIQVTQASPAPTVQRLRLLKTNAVRWPITTNGLVLFDRCDVHFNHSQNLKSLFSPVPGNFLNIKQTQDAVFNPSLKNVQEQSNLGNIRNSCMYVLTDENNFDPVVLAKTKEKLASSDSDGPSHDQLNSDSFFGKRFFLNIDMFPFRTVSPYLSEKYKIKKHSMLPPNSTLRIVLHKNPLKPQHLLPTTSTSPHLEAENDENTSNTQWAVDDFSVNINAIYLRCFRMKCLDNVIPPEIKNFSYNLQTTFFDLIPLQAHTQQTHRPAWKFDRTPVYCIISFLRENDVMPKKSWIQIQASNCFYKPKHLKTLTVRCTDFKNETLDNISIDNLDVENTDKSKLAYLDYLKINNFVDGEFKFENLFPTNELTKDGQLNMFPVNLNGSELPSKTFVDGIQIDLDFRQSLETRWYLCIRYDFLGMGQFVPKEKKYIFRSSPNFSI